MVRAIYIGIDPRLTGAAGYSVLAHLEDLVGRGIVATDGDPVIGGSYRLANSASASATMGKPKRALSSFSIRYSPLAAALRLSYFFATPFAGAPWPAQPASSAPESCPRRC